MEFKKRIRIISIKEFRIKFSSEENCLDYLAKLRWPNGFVCPTCQNQGSYRQAERGFYRCKACDNKVSVIAGTTVFHNTNLRLTDWFWAIYRMAQDKKSLLINITT